MLHVWRLFPSAHSYSLRTPHPRILPHRRAKEGEHELLESSLRGATSLLRAAHDGPELCALALPLARALLHLPNQYELDGFTEARHGALLALVVRRPEPLARWLCSEFYGTNRTP